MKTLVVVASGAADRPLEELGGRTPLESAATPVLDRLAREGRVGRLTPAPDGMRPEEGAFVLGLFGLDPRSYGDAGAALDAAAFDIPVGAKDKALRLSLVTADAETVFDPTAGRISRDESALLLEALTEDLDDDDLQLHAGVGGQGVLIWKGARDVAVETLPPFEIVGKDLPAARPRGAGLAPLTRLIDRSADVLPAHEVNELRTELGENPATLAWPWGPGVSLPLPEFTTRTGIEAAFVGTQPSARGAARLQGLTLAPVPEPTMPGAGSLRADAKAALKLLETHDLVFLHTDALAEASKGRDFVGKLETLERMDGYVLGLAQRAIEQGLRARLVVIGGEAVSTETGRYLPDPVPFVIYGEGVRSHRRGGFTEVSARDGGFQVDRPHELMDFLLHLPS